MPKIFRTIDLPETKTVSNDSRYTVALNITTGVWVAIKFRAASTGREIVVPAVPPLAAITVKRNPAAAWCPSNDCHTSSWRPPVRLFARCFPNAFLENVFPTKPWENHCLFRWVPVITSTSHSPKAVRHGEVLQTKSRDNFGWNIYPSGN